MSLFEKAHNLLQRIRTLLSSRRATLELTGRAEKEYKRIMSELKQMTPEERMDFFQNMKSEPIRFMKKIDGTIYVIRTFFQPVSNEDLLDRAEQFMVRNL